MNNHKSMLHTMIYQRDIVCRQINRKSTIKNIWSSISFNLKINIENSCCLNGDVTCDKVCFHIFVF